MAKPIFTIGLPRKINDSMFANNLENKLKLEYPDYYVLVYGHSGDDPALECFYEKDFNEVKFEELKQIVKDKLK